MSQLESHPSSSSCLPSSSTAIPTRWKYEVFLSFRGPDTRKGITVDIRDRLQSRGIRTFMDDRDLEPGDPISRNLIEAIEESRFAVVVFSQNYASSTWCLEELAKIWECMANQGRIFPLFYHVDPTEVRYQKKGSFEEAFSKHKTSGQHKLEIVEQWRAALQGVANISGWNTDAFKTHRELVDNIVESLCSKVPPDAIESTDDFQAYEATTKAMDEVKEVLSDEEITAVGIYGMGGVGKTTLVTHVAIQACRNSTFNHWIIATISQDPDTKQIQGTLSDLLGVKLVEETDVGRAAKLRQEIIRREKLLIILDDLWDKVELSKIGIPNSKELQTVNSKVLLTTRRMNVCHVMGCERTIVLNILSKEDSWALFMRKARRSFEQPKFMDVAKKVAGECGGLPIALITVARALGDKEMVEWERAAKRLEKSQTANPDDNGEAFKCIKLSYDYLNNKEYKSYFLLCCLFPEASFIPKEKLFMFAIGKGLFQDAETLEEARENASSVVNHLIYSCLLLGSADDAFVRMHDVVRDTALQIAESKDGYGFLVKAGSHLKVWPRQLHEGYTAISLMRSLMSKLPKNLVCPKLEILLLNGNTNLKVIPETFFQSPYELKALDLSWTSISSLPQSFSLLTNLQALYLDNCHGLNLVTDYSILGNLEKLEILSIRKSIVREFSMEMGGLTNLRMLDHTGGLVARIPSELISKLHNLEELYLPGFWLWGAKVQGEGEESNVGFDELTSLSRLRVLKVSMFDVESIPKSVESVPDWVEFDIRIGKNDPCKIQSRDEDDRHGHITHMNSICLKLDIISRLPYWFRSEIMKKTEHLVWEEG